MMMNWKGFGSNFKVLSRHLAEETMKNLIQDSQSPGPRIEPGSSRI
jgi:hypothetical protein